MNKFHNFFNGVMFFIIFGIVLLLSGCASNTKYVPVSEVVVKKIPAEIIVQLKDSCLPPVNIPSLDMFKTEEDYNNQIVAPNFARLIACNAALDTLYKWNENNGEPDVSLYPLPEYDIRKASI